MKLSKVLEQHIAVFGESGSGKTVLLSSFYGATQEPQFWSDSLYRVSADSIGQHSTLYRNYLGMRDDAQRPMADRLQSTSYSFTLKLKQGGTTSEQIDALRLVWHDYPGEWFETDVGTPTEAQHRVETFRTLLVSDVAVLLVDGQRLLDNAGHEERYLKSLFVNFRNAFEKLRGSLLADGKPLEEFPRIWMLALSKADVHPGLDVFRFRDLVISKAADELSALRTVLTDLTDSGEEMAVGEDFVLLSSATFDPTHIDVTKRVGLNLILPLASILPLQRRLRWDAKKHAGLNAAEKLVQSAAALAKALIGKKDGKKDQDANRVRQVARLAGYLLDAAVEPTADKLKELHDTALDKRNFTAAVLTGFGLDLSEGDAQRILLRSER
jgi:hypothetical protein